MRRAQYHACVKVTSNLRAINPSNSMYRTSTIEYSVAAIVTIVYFVVGVIIDNWVGTFKVIKLFVYFQWAAILLK